MLIINNDAMPNGMGGHTSIVSVDDTRQNLIVFMRSRTTSMIRRESMVIVIHTIGYTSLSELMAT